MEEEKASKLAYMEYLGLPPDDDDRASYLNKMFGFVFEDKEEENLGEPIEVMYAENIINKESFLNIWYNAWGFCSCGDPIGATKFICSTLKTLEEKGIYTPENSIQNFALFALNTLGLITHKDDIEHSWVTPKGKLILNFLENTNLDNLFKIESEREVQDSREIAILKV